MHTHSLRRSVSSVLICCFAVLPALLVGQEKPAQPEAKKSAPPQIADEPKTIDPALHVPPKLAAKVTVNFADSSLKEIAKWITENQKIPVLFDTKAMSDHGILLSDPLTDHLNNEPLYLLLNRLQSLGLGWYVDEDILHITTEDAEQLRHSTESYNVGDLLDAGYKSGELIDAIVQMTEGPWESVGGEGQQNPELLGDVLFARQSDRSNLRVVGFLEALRRHGRQTFTSDPPQHIPLREKLDANVSVDFKDIPLAEVVSELAAQTKADIRLDSSTVHKAGVREREPISLTLTDRKLRTVLQALFNKLSLTWILRDGVLWITTSEKAEASAKTAIYDVRDLCRNEDESGELEDAIQSQTGGPWEANHGEGGTIMFAKPGTMVIRQSESGHREVLELLGKYRKALTGSKRRDRDLETNPVSTRYYRLDSSIANSLIELLPKLVQPETWKSDKNPNGPGTVIKAAAGSDVVVAKDESGAPNSGATSKDAVKGPAVLLARTVLIIQQSRIAHEEIAKIITRIQQGDSLLPDPAHRGAGQGRGGAVGGGGGGFGGGLFPGN